MGNMNVTVIDQNNVNIAVTPTPTQTINIDRGIIGVSGISGYSGYSGYSGIGSSGYSGLSGFSGYSGISGWSGESGTSGYSGYSGIGESGYSGFSGYSGDSGISGFSGDSGISGYSGESGISGYSGFSGQQGTSINVKGEVPTVGDLPPTGNQVNDAYIVTEDGNLWVWNGSAWYDAGQIVGPQGLSGFSGYSGESGYSGFSGDSGISGWSGESGISGFSGDSGISGWSGFSGESGYSGLNGDSGYSGISGYSGFSGDSGISGWSGISGYSGSGISGWSGFSGYSGISGQDGASGFSGYSGISGYSGSGISGYSGYSGIGTSGYSGFSGYSGYSGAVGAGGAIGNWGSFWDTTTQTTTINTPTAITFNSYDVDSTGVSIGSPTSRIVFANSGTYSLTFSIQFTNTSTANGATQIWLKKNGTNIPDTNSHFDVPDKQGSAFSSEILTVNFVFNVTANDYVQLYWDTTNASVSLETIAGNGTYPRTPSVIFTATQVMYGQSGYSGISGYSGYSGFSGISGFSGESGISGYSGSGVSGWSGASGYSGYSGEVGTSGYSGYSGISGTNGASGFSGISGYSGYSGIDGASGFSGYSGISGYSGSGVSGYSGFSGISGYSGYSGITPAIGGSNTQVQYNNSGSLGGSSGLTWDGSFLTTSSIKNSALTSGRVTFAGASGLLSDSANFTYNGTLLSVSATGSSATTLAQFRQLISGVNTGDARITVGNEVYNPLVIGQNAGSSGFTYGTTNDAFFVNTANSGMLFGTNGTERMRITSTGNVGIGTSSPARILELKASQSAMVFNDNTNQWTIGTGSFIDGSNSFNFYLGGVGSYLRINSSGNLGLGLGLVPSAWLASSKAMQIGDYASFWWDGYTGSTAIGNNVYQSGNTTDNYIVSGVAPTRYRLAGGAHSWFIAPSGTAGNAISFTQAMTLDASGNLGIGLTNPLVRLHISNSVTNTGGTGTDILRVANTRVNTGSSGAAISFVTNEISGSTQYTRAQITGEYDGSSNINGRLLFATTNISGDLQERMRITSTGLVGIGTSSPQANLQVTSSAFPVLKVADGIGGGAVALGDSTISSNYVGIWRGAVNSISGGGFLNVQGNGIAFMSTDNVFGSATRTMTLDNSGNLGIGTSSQNERLRLNSATAGQARMSISYQDTTISFYGSYSGIVGAGNATDTFLSSQAVLAFGSGGTTERMRIDSSGNVNIGTTGVAEKLVVNGPVVAKAQLQALQAGSTVIDFIPAENKSRIIATGTDDSTYPPIVFANTTSTTYAERMRIDSSGNLLVGDTSVIGSGKLSIKSDNSVAMKGVTSTSGGNIVMYRADTSARIWEITANSSNFFIANGDFTSYAYLAATPTVWLFASDRRIKTDIVDIEYGLNAVMAMKPRKYKMLASGETNIGFVAQELQTVIPEAVAGEEIEYLETDTPQEKAAKTMGVSKDTLIPVLVKAIQEQQVLIESLTTRLTALENK